MKEIIHSNRFKRDFKLASKRQLDMGKLGAIVDMLIHDVPYPCDATRTNSKATISVIGSVMWHLTGC